MRWMKKVTALAAATVMTVGLLVGSALADSGAGASPAPADPAWLATLQQNADQITALKGQASTLEQQIKVQTDINKGLAQGLHESTSQKDLKAQRAQLAAQIHQADTAQLKPIRDQIKDLRTQVKSKKEREQRIVLEAQVRHLQAQLQQAEGGLKALRDQMKALEQQMKASEASTKALERQAKVLVDQEKALWATDRDLRKAVANSWKAYEAADKADNHDGILSALTTIIDSRQKINTNLQAILERKKQLTTLLQTAATGGSAGSTRTPAAQP